jgi:hypothetical protein
LREFNESLNSPGADSLLKNKQATGRTKDAEDVARLKAIRARERRPG